MKRIWKFELPVSDVEYALAFPAEAGRILHVAMANTAQTHVWMWAEVERPRDPAAHADATLRTFRTFGTGHEIPPPPTGFAREYVGTAVGPRLVWHVYETIKEPPW